MSEDHRDAELAWRELQESLVVPPTLLSASDMLAAAQIEPSFLVKNMIPAGAITLVVGIPGAKKSWLAYSLALATARGSSWLGVPVTPKGGSCNVLVFNYDNPTPECGRRFKRLGMTKDDPIFFHSVDLDPLRLPGAADSIRAIVQAKQPSLVVIDSFRQAHESDENSSSDMAKVMGCYKQLYANGCSVVIVHHANKSELATGLSKTRGSGEIPASADCQIDVSFDKEAGSDVAFWAKHRSWEISDLEASLEFELVDSGDSTILRLR